MIKIILQRFKESVSAFAVIIFVCISQMSFSQIQIDSVRTTLSTCPNNGNISVYAKGTNPPLYYSIVAGPVTEPVQTGNIFNALPPGNYTIKVSDGLGNSSSKGAIINGHYVALDFNPLKTNPYCAGNSNGKIIGNRVNNSGYGPFTWQLIAPSTVTTAPQSSDTFNNLPAGNYTMRLTDACGSFRTIVVTLSDPATAMLSFIAPPRIEIVNCTSAMVTLFMQASFFRFPMTYKFETTNGVFTTTVPTAIDSSNGSSYFTVQQLLSNFTYGNYLKVTVTDNCGYSVSTDIGYARTFTFCPAYTSKFNNCTYLTQIDFDINNIGCFNSNNLYTGLSAPVTYQFIDAVTNLIADSGTISGDPAHTWYNAISGVLIKPVPGNKTYNLIIKDACGNVFTNSYHVVNPTSPPPRIDYKSVAKLSCLDSAATISIATNYFKSEPHLIMLSGPSDIGSTKPGYAYHDTFLYPDTFNYTSWGGGADARYNFEITNLAAGTYRFKVIDSCGSEIADSIVIKKTDLTDFGHKFWYKKGCLGKNEIHYSINSGSGYMLINYPLGVYKYYSGSTSINDSILNVPSGTYQLIFTYNSYPGALPANSSPLACTSITDNITIEGYQTPAISTSNSIICHNTINVELVPDSSKGVPPYQYEIISGPQTFPMQNGNTFQVTVPGTYTARIYDICGNASTKQIFINDIAFAPVDAMTSCNNMQLVYPSSSYYDYKWTKPNNTIFTGDSLVIDPVTPADTGTYSISKIININGCRDTLHTSYHISLPNFSKQIIPFCNGGAVHVGTKVYSTPGLYADTLHTGAGCDSIILTSLVVLPQKVDSNHVTICKGDNIAVDSHIYNMPGIYKDSSQNSAGCYDITFTNLKVMGIPDTISKTICLGNSISIGNNIYKNSGTYTDTLISHLGCDSIIVLELTVIPNSVVAEFTPNPAVGPSPLTTSFNNLSSGATKYSWTFGNLNTSAAIQPSTVYSVNGNYSVMLIASDNVCSDTAYATIHVQDNSPQQQLCSGASGPPVFFEDFGSGTASFGPALPAGITNYIYHVPTSVGSLVDDQYVISNSSCFIYNTGWWKCNSDHTGNPNGYMMVVNGSTTQSEVYRKHITGLCPNTRYVLSAWVANANAFNQFCGTYIYANIDFKAEYPAGNVISTINTDTLTYQGTNLAWINAGISFVTEPGQTWADVVIYNQGAGTCGNDFVIDDISLIHCPGAFNPEISLVKNLYCEEDSILLTQTGITGYSNPQYQWQYSPSNSTVFTDITGATNPAYTITKATTANSGSYQLLISENGNINSPDCRIIAGPKNITVLSSPDVHLGKDTAICQGQTVLFNAGSGYSAYYWNHNFSDSTKHTLTVNPSVTTSYSVTVYDAHHCASMDEITVYVNPLPIQPPFENNYIEHCFEDGPSVIGPDWGKSFIWNNTGDTTQTIAISQEGSYTVTVFDNYGCSITGHIFVNENCKPQIFVPKAFSPNNDGENDDLDIFGKYFKNFEMKIFNRWGEIIFITNDRNIRWDGLYRGELMPVGSYPWIIKYESSFEDNPGSIIINGAVTLIR